MNRILFLALLSAGIASCKQKGANPQPPPIEQGKCLVNEYRGGVAMSQSCQHVGYSWDCRYVDHEYHCKRVSESVGERPLPLDDAGVPDSVDAPVVTDDAPAK